MRLALVLVCATLAGCASTQRMEQDIASLWQQVAETRELQKSFSQFAADFFQRIETLSRQEAQLRKDMEAIRSTASRDPAARDAILRMEEYVRSLEKELREMRKVVDRIEIVTVTLPGIPPQDGLRVKPR